MQTVTITKDKIIKLFNDIWPKMTHAALHREHCIKHLDDLQQLFRRHGKDKDVLLRRLCGQDGIKVVIASGLLYAVWGDECVPFDKYTTSYALHLRIIKDNKITKNYR